MTNRNTKRLPVALLLAVMLIVPAVATANIVVDVRRDSPSSAGFNVGSAAVFTVAFRIENNNTGTDSGRTNTGDYTLTLPDDVTLVSGPAQTKGYGLTRMDPSTKVPFLGLTWTLQAPTGPTIITITLDARVTAVSPYKVFDKNDKVLDSVSFTVNVLAPTDTTPPVVTIHAPVAGFYRTATLPALDYSVDDESDYGVVVTGWSAEEGLHTVTVTATDAYLNVGSASVTYTVDNTPPETSIVLGGTLSGGWYTGPVYVDLSAIDPSPASGVKCIEYKLGAGAWATYAGGLSITADGITTLSYRAVDNVGNVEAMHETTIQIDQTPPTLDILVTGLAGNSPWYVSPVQVQVTAGDDVSGLALVQYRINGSAWVTYTGPLWVNDDGIYTLECVAWDAAGNSYALAPEVIRIDQTPPVITASRNPAPNVFGWNNTEVIASYAATDAASGLAAGDEAGSYTFSSEGAGQSHTFTVYDVAGNPASATIENVNIDWTAPTTAASLAGPTGNEDWYIVPVVVTLTATDMPAEGSGVAGIYRDENGEETFEDGSTVEFTMGGQGENTLAYWAVDRAENEEMATEITLKIDTMPPVVTVALPGTGEYVLGQTVLAAWSAEDPVPGSGIADPNKGEITIPTTELGEQTYWTPQGLAQDIAGNLSDPTRVDYMVKYGFLGLLSPYKAPPASFKVGSSIPLKWKYINASGIALDTPNANPLVVIKKGSSFTAGAGDAILVEDPGNSGYQYDPVTKMHQFNWQTKGLAVGTYEVSITCRETGQTDGPFEIQLKK